MAPSVIPEVSPLLNREKAFSTPPVRKNSNNMLTIIMLVAVVLLCVAGLSRMAVKPAAPEVVRVVGAARDLSPGCRLGFTSLHYIQIPKAYYTAGMPVSYADVVGSVTTSFIAKGEPILTTQLLPNRKGLSPTININERAMTLQLTDDALLDHMVYPGDRVDVIATLTANSKKYTQTVCQNVLVLMSVPKESLHAGGMSSGDQNKITLAVSPEDSEKLTQALEMGKVRLVMRNPLNSARMRLGGISDADLLPATATMPLPAVAPAGFSTAQALTAPPPPPVFNEEPALPQPVQWLVEVFQGSRKESLPVPNR